MGQRKTITAIATQGNAYVERDSRLKEYYIQYSDDGSNWKDYTYEGQRKARIRLTGVGLGIFFFLTNDIHQFEKSSFCALSG